MQNVTSFNKIYATHPILTNLSLPNLISQWRYHPHLNLLHIISRFKKLFHARVLVIQLKTASVQGRDDSQHSSKHSEINSILIL